MKKKILILENDESLLTKLRINIRKFDVIPTTSLYDALSKLVEGGISFIAADIRLNHGERGYEVFDRLFFKGKSIPGIVITAYELSDGEEEYLSKIGVEKLAKVGEKGLLSARIEQAAESILNDRKSCFRLITQKINGYNLKNNNMTFDGVTKSIQEFMDEVLEGIHSIEEEETIRDEMVKVCNALIKHDSENDYGFPQI